MASLLSAVRGITKPRCRRLTFPLLSLFLLILSGLSTGRRPYVRVKRVRFFDSVRELEGRIDPQNQVISASRRSPSPDALFPIPRPCAFPIPRIAVRETPRQVVESPIVEAFPIPRVVAFLKPRVAHGDARGRRRAAPTPPTGAVNLGRGPRGGGPRRPPTRLLRSCFPERHARGTRCGQPLNSRILRLHRA